MKNQSDVETNQINQMNVIQFGKFQKDLGEKLEPKKWSRDKKRIPNDVMFPSSKNYPEYLSDDPLEDLLSEFDSILNEEYKEESKEVSEENKYVFDKYCRSNYDYKISYKDSLSTMMDKLEKQIKKVKEDSKRIKFYLDEIE
jgi:hypothetical protein